MFSTKWFDGFENINDCVGIREEVFCNEQGISRELEFDGTDNDAVILVIYEDGKPVATGRIIKEKGNVQLGRIAVKKAYRGKKYGDLIVRMLIRKSYDLGYNEQYVHAQISAKGFYEKLGFTAFGQEYLEAGIPHVSMVHEGDISVCGD